MLVLPVNRDDLTQVFDEWRKKAQENGWELDMDAPDWAESCADYVMEKLYDIQSRKTRIEVTTCADREPVYVDGEGEG